MVPRENKNNAYAKFRGTNKDYYGIFRSGVLQFRSPKTQYSIFSESNSPMNASKNLNMSISEFGGLHQMETTKGLDILTETVDLLIEELY